MSHASICSGARWRQGQRAEPAVEAQLRDRARRRGAGPRRRRRGRGAAGPARLGFGLAAKSTGANSRAPPDAAGAAAPERAADEPRGLVLDERVRVHLRRSSGAAGAMRGSSIRAKASRISRRRSLCASPACRPRAGPAAPWAFPRCRARAAAERLDSGFSSIFSRCGRADSSLISASASAARSRSHQSSPERNRMQWGTASGDADRDGDRDGQRRASPGSALRVALEEGADELGAELAQAPRPPGPWPARRSSRKVRRNASAMRSRAPASR